MFRRFATFDTDDDGRPIEMPQLDPRTTYVLGEDEDPPPADRFPSRERVAAWIDNCVFGDLRTLTAGIDQYVKKLPEPEGLGGGNFLLAAGCCMALEYLGQVYGEGRDATSGVARYVSDFMDPRYSDLFELLWTCLRNGILHGAWPQAVRIRDEERPVLEFWVSPGGDGPHLQPHPGASGPSIEVNAGILFTDIRKSFDQKFRRWILNDSDDGVLERAAPRLLLVHPRDRKKVQQVRTVESWITKLA